MEKDRGTVSALLLSISLVSTRFPRLLAWPLAALGALLGGLRARRATESVTGSAATAVPYGIVFAAKSAC